MMPVMDAFLKDHSYSDTAHSFVERLKAEMAYYEENKDCYGYVFYIGRKSEPKG